MRGRWGGTEMRRMDGVGENRSGGVELVGMGVVEWNWFDFTGIRQTYPTVKSIKNPQFFPANNPSTQNNPGITNQPANPRNHCNKGWGKKSGNLWERGRFYTKTQAPQPPPDFPTAALLLH
ncbi:hypothetical protein Pcinc_032005 [Petrolisthes cinctipes]|uniref:Uncharacterized protein n=1 Tax=Petrolisthes cinctipes TaxID=88211 RepID=A0AAE1EVE4_PETCI|nr:hypothetical protein Pcinc_032005 [Petrolisthes cinctipes]